MILRLWEIRLTAPPEAGKEDSVQARERRLGKDGIKAVDEYTGAEVSGPYTFVRKALGDMGKTPHTNRALLPISSDVNEVWW